MDKETKAINHYMEHCSLYEYRMIMSKWQNYFTLSDQTSEEFIKAKRELAAYVEKVAERLGIIL